MKNSIGYPSELQDVGPTQGGVINGDHQHVGLFGGEQRLTDKLRVAQVFELAPSPVSKTCGLKGTG